MSTGAVVKAKKELLTHFWIKVEPGDPNKNEADVVTIVDVWLANFKIFDKLRREKAAAAGVHNMHTPCSHSAHPCSYCERKKEPIEESVSHTHATGSSKRKPKKFDDTPEVPMPDEFKQFTEELRDAGLKVLGEWSSVIDLRVEHVAWVARAESTGALGKNWSASWRGWLTLAIKRAKEAGANPAAETTGAVAGADEDTVEARVRRRTASSQQNGEKSK
jgi:hypothetical protein